MVYPPQSVEAKPIYRKKKKSSIQLNLVLSAWGIGAVPNKFVADAMLGRLAKWLRIMGYDAHYRAFYKPGQVHSLVKEGRVFLTRNTQCIGRCKGLVFVRSDHVQDQLRQLRQEGLIEVDRAAWFTRCMLCNEPLLPAPFEAVSEKVPDHVLLENPSGIRFCPTCNRFFWPGSHKKKMLSQLRVWGF
jgi:uncharacterized protein